ncbi:MAG: 4-alpha-glucanotransferase [Candidatus Cloacimonas sp. SDB]|nr:MAG: 4-alpha-glucanotransferase [Candidatus Cloacimonas sp. SDB]
MNLTRSGGILLHLTSLPGATGIGTLGKNALEFIDFLEQAQQKIWQILPTGPTGYGDSPYQTFSAFAGSPLLIDLDELCTEGLLEKSQIPDQVDQESTKIDFGELNNAKYPILKRAFQNFSPTPEFADFCRKEAYWLEDYSLFMALKNKFQGVSWLDWDKKFKFRDKAALEQSRNDLKTEIELQKFLQFTFFKQWQKIKAYAGKNNISIMGDIPIFVAMDSSDVWAHNEIFQFDENLNPLALAGVPPDYFSDTGQLWGNPLYNWESLKNSDFDWWKNRFAAILDTTDLVRLDHFRGFAGYWSVPFGAENAVKGEWKTAPGNELFTALKNSFGDLPVIAEDLGVITDDVIELRDKFGFPGMKVLQFAFGSGPDNPFLPHNFSENCVVYTGTHDNDTTLGWYQKLPENIKNEVLDYLDSPEPEINWKMIEAAWKSKAALAIAPMQDFLGLDSSARMNMPSSLGSNWQWRLIKKDLDLKLARKIRDLTWKYDR